MLVSNEFSESSKCSKDDLWVTWDAYHRAIEQLALQVYESGWQFDQILCLARGGLRLGDVFSRIFNLPLAILASSSYREQSGTQRGELEIGDSITISQGTLGGKVLVLDDLVDSGVTMEQVLSHVSKNFPTVTELKSAVIWYKACSPIRPDFYVDYLDNNLWIHQPFEIYDNLRPEQLAAWLKKEEILS